MDRRDRVMVNLGQNEFVSDLTFVGLSWAKSFNPTFGGLGLLLFNFDCYNRVEDGKYTGAGRQESAHTTGTHV